MKSAVIVSALVGVVLAAPQGVTDKISPDGGIPTGNSANYDGNFEITVAQVTFQKRDIQKRAECGANGVLVLSLKDESLYDAQDRTGYIASNYQFQFDGPPQAGAIYTSGFSVSANNLLALGQNETFYRCLSGDFYNLYSENWAPQCEAVNILAIPCGSNKAATQLGDGQVVGTTVVQTTIITALPDGQPQVITTSVPVPVTSYFPTSAPVSQISDGQIQVPPPQTPTSVATASVTTYPVTSVPAETGSVVLPTESVPVSGGASTGSTGAVSSPSVTKSASATTSAGSSSAAGSSSTAAATTSALASSGASAVTGSISALVVAIIAFACL